MARQRPVLAAFGTDGPLLAAIVDALCDLHDLLDERLPVKAATSGGPVRISEPAPTGPPAKAAPISEPAPDVAPDDKDELTEPAPDLPDPPPRAGRGSSQSAWVAWAKNAGVTVGSSASRDDIITACEAAGVLSDS